MNQPLDPENDEDVGEEVEEGIGDDEVEFALLGVLSGHTIKGNDGVCHLSAQQPVWSGASYRDYRVTTDCKE